MWLLTSLGFFSIVQKPADERQGTLTIRARVRQDLEALGARYLPGMTTIQESRSNDYRFRAQAPRSEVAAAMASVVNDLTYSNFKDKVAKEQGSARAHLYHDVWSVLHRLQEDAAHAKTGPVFHPQRDEHGNRVEISKPSQDSALSLWAQESAIAMVTPNGAMPEQINGIPITDWVERPDDSKAWEAFAAESSFEEPPFNVPVGYKPAAGVVIREPDGRIWVVAPTNGYAGYKATFPKGRLDGKTMRAAALVEAYEESGLRVRLLRHLVDVKRTETYTRYYLAERIGGNPASMGWESQAVMLVPEEKLPQVLNNANDTPIIKALKND